MATKGDRIASEIERYKQMIQETLERNIYPPVENRHG